MDFESRFLQYQQNVYPAMVESLAGDLGVTVESINKLGIGFCPGSQSWVWVERDNKGEITGLLHRYPDGKKQMEKGSHRGLIYEFFSTLETNKRGGTSKRNNFIRAYNAGVDCPLCGKRDWCLVSDDSPQTPSAIICGRTPEGAIKHIEGAGYLHIKKGNKLHNAAHLSTSSRPYIVCEGPTDVLAAMDMGYVAIGRPSAEGRVDWVASLLRGQEVIVVGENDDVGRRGMQKMFQALKAVCSSIKKILPPVQHKDFRDWHPTTDEFELWVEQHADKADLEKVLESADPRYLAKHWLQENFQSGDYRLLHYCNEDWYQYNKSHYEKLPNKQVDAQLTAFLDKYEHIRQFGEKKTTEPFCMTRRFIDDVKFNLCTLCYLSIPDNSYQPFRIMGKEFLDTKRAIVFRNGIYHVDTDKFEVVTPDLFVVSPLPYKYQPNLDCLLWRTFVWEVFDGDQQSMDLLQEWFGYNLIASNHMESMMFFFGGRAAGKSTTVDVLQAMLGSNGYAAIDTVDFISQFGFESLIGKYALVVSEDRPVGRANKDKVLSKIKQITGQDTIIIRRKFRTPINIKPFFKISYVSNDLPDFSDESGSFMRRLNLLFYPNCYEDNPDRTLKGRLVNEAPGIAIWAIEGLKRLITNGRFTLPDRSKEHLSDIQLLTNPLRAMMREHCIENPGTYIPCSDLYDLHKAICQENQSAPMSQIMFGIKLKSVMPAFCKTRRRVGGELVYVYDGIQILPSAQRRYLGKPI